ncbi:unnamed protein product [Malus baccata var. baccata]
MGTRNDFELPLFSYIIFHFPLTPVTLISLDLQKVLYPTVSTSSKMKTQSENQDIEPINLDQELDLSESSFDDTGRKRKRTSVVWQHFENMSCVDDKEKSPVITGDGSVKHVAYSFDEGRDHEVLQMSKSKIAITTDMWTSSNQKRRFMAITSHFIDALWPLQSQILRFAYVPCPHNAETLSAIMIDCLLEWNIDRKLSALTVNNCSTNDTMIEDIVTYCKLSLVLNGELFHMRCCAHILNLIVKDGLDVIRDGIETIWNSVAYWSRTAKREEKFVEIAQQMKIKLSRKLVLDCKTRWNSTYVMLTTALIRIAICKWLECDHVEVKLMATKMSIKFEKYWHKIHGAMAIVAILNPRFKMKLIVVSESSFSTGGRIISPHRSRLHSSTVEALMCSRDWLWGQMRDSNSTRVEDSSFGDDTDVNVVDFEIDMEESDMSKYPTMDSSFQGVEVASALSLFSELLVSRDGQIF